MCKFEQCEYVTELNKDNNKEKVSEISKNKIKWIRSLQQKKTRDEEGLFVLEGEKMVDELIRTFPQLIHTIVHTSDFTVSAPLSSYESYEVSQTVLEQVSGFKTPNKALAVLKKSIHSLPNKDKLILALDDVQDPGNMGTIMRIADWFGIEDIVCSNETVEHYNPKVVQSSMGAILRIRVHYTDLIEFLNDYPDPVYGALLEGDNIYTTKLSDKGIILLGNEGKGISKSLQEKITHKISIPRFGQAESLNVSVAAGIIVSEFKRSL
jgi:RNA methyltransferase, TrmH family